MQIRSVIFVLTIVGSAMAQTPISQMPNAIPICTDSQACVITAVSDPNARFQFGAGTTWCQTFNTPAMPLAVSSTPVNLLLCKYDPAPNQGKTLLAQQRNTPYAVTYRLNGIVQPVKTIPGLVTIPTSVPAAISTFPAICTNYSDTTFSCTATGPVTPVVKN